MGVQDLQAFLESPGLEGGAVSVDLLKIARNISAQRHQQLPQHGNKKQHVPRQLGNKLKLVLDAEQCLDRLYGGYFSDWACGGQWNRMVQFLSILMQEIERGNIDLAVVFNGTLEFRRMSEWTLEQAEVRSRVGMVLKHINTKATPPPKIWWTPPACLRTALRMALRHLGTTVMCTMDDHHQEVIAFCREYGYHGLLADDAEYAAFDPPRYFSSENIKLTYKGSLETKEYMISELTRTLQISMEQLCVVAALLGNFLLPEEELLDLYRKLNLQNARKNEKVPETFIKGIAEYVRSLPSVSNMDALVNEVFGNDSKRASALRQSVQYYLNGTAGGFLKYCTPPATKQDNRKKTVQLNNNTAQIAKSDEHELDTSGFASESTEQEQEILQNYKLAMANIVMSTDLVELNDAESSTKNEESPPSSDTSRFNGLSNGSYTTNNCGSSSSNIASSHPAGSSGSSGSGGTRVNLVSSSSSNASSIPPSPRHADLVKVTKTGAARINSNSGAAAVNVSADVLRTASLRHQKGLMSPWILHVLSSQEVRLPCLLEDENNREFPPIHEIYSLLRQHVYAVLFNLHHMRYVQAKKKESGEIPENVPQPEVTVLEWVYTTKNPYQHPQVVKAEPLPWAVPTLQRLWFGPSVDDKCRRMRALLSCLNSDTPLILNTSYVPQHMLIMACVLRYLMSLDKPIMRRQELDAFLCQAFNPDLMNTQYLLELTLNVVTSRGVQLAALFMHGVEVALLANDACGAPLPWLLCCPWLYFDGKLFHYTLALSAHAKNLLELCQNHIDRVVKVERMRKAILEGLEYKFAKMPLPPFTSVIRQGLPPPHCLPAVPLPSTRGAAGLRQRPMPSRGGQLQVAGVVVGSWGANYGYQPNVRQPLVSYQGGRGRGVPANFLPHPPPHLQQHQQQPFQRGRQQQQQHRKQGLPTYPVNRKNNETNKKRFNPNKQNKQPASRGRGLTLKTENGDVLASELLKEEAHSPTEDVIYEDCKQSEHQGQGDGPQPQPQPQPQQQPEATH